MKSKIIKYGVIGSNGRLGTEVVNVFNENRHLQVLSLNLDEEVVLEKPDVIIDCSLPAAFDKTFELIQKFNVPLIMAVTGLQESHLKKLKQISVSSPVVQSFNFSPGVQVMLKLTEMAYEKLGDWDIEISETHHRFKKDKPSGTAKMISNVFKGREINISSLRLGNVPGEHKVSFGSLGEVLSISHSATSRRTFAEGILLSAVFILSKEKGFYSFTDVMFNK